MKINQNLTAVVDPIFLTTIFSHKNPEHGGYGRVDNPTRLLLEQKLAELEKAKYAIAFSSGSAAISTVFTNLNQGDHILCHKEIYEGTLRLLEKVFYKFGIEFTLCDFNNDNFIKFINKNTKIIFFENVTNPTLSCIDTKRIRQLIKNNNVEIVVDNTFATPIFKNPLLEGADVVVHSLTKYIGGHHDVMGGALMLNNCKLFQNYKFLQYTIGSVLSPFDCFLIQRGIETLKVRMTRHNENAKIVYSFLKNHKLINHVTYPGISGVVTFWISEKLKPNIFLSKLKKIKIAHSFGGTITTILQPTKMMSLSISSFQKKQMKINDNLFRLSVGLEEVDEIIGDLKKAII